MKLAIRDLSHPSNPWSPKLIISSLTITKIKKTISIQLKRLKSLGMLMEKSMDTTSISISRMIRTLTIISIFHNSNLRKAAIAVLISHMSKNKSQIHLHLNKEQSLISLSSHLTTIRLLFRESTAWRSPRTATHLWTIALSQLKIRDYPLLMLLLAARKLSMFHLVMGILLRHPMSIWLLRRSLISLSSKFKNILTKAISFSQNWAENNQITKFYN